MLTDSPTKEQNPEKRARKENKTEGQIIYPLSFLFYLFVQILGKYLDYYEKQY